MDSPSLFVSVLSAIVTMFISALFLRLGTRLGAGFTPSFGNALGAVFLSYICCIALGFVVGFAFGLGGSEMSKGAEYALIGIALLIQPVVYSFVLRDPDTGEGISFFRAIWVMIVQFLLIMLIALVITAIILVIVQFTK